MYWREDESSSKRKNIRLGHSRRACEVNSISGQQQEPTESSLLFEMGTGRNPRPLGRGGCQSNELLYLVLQFKFLITNNRLCNLFKQIFINSAAFSSTYFNFNNSSGFTHISCF